MLGVIIKSIMLSVVRIRVGMLSVRIKAIMLSVTMLRVIIKSIMASVVMPNEMRQCECLRPYLDNFFSP
jgi:hypothetical protein